MIPAIRSEIRKILTIRSTYIMSVIALAFILFMSFMTSRSISDSGFNPSVLTTTINGMSMLMGTFCSIAGLLIMSHEYRYNTIVYTITASRSRSNVLLSKMVTVTLYSLVMVIAGTLVALLGAYIGPATSGFKLISQDINILTVLVNSMLFCIANGLVGILIVVLTRNQILSLAILFLGGMVEGLLSLVLKSNSQYLPFSALGRLINQSGVSDFFGSKPLSPYQGLAVFMIYLVTIGMVAWVLFMRRDAN